jgi:hypothetical protein
MDKKQAYEERLKAQLEEWNAKIDVLKAKAKKAEAGVGVEYYETIDNIKAKQVVAKNKLAEMREAGDDAWEDLKEGLEGAWNSLGDAVKSATSRFKE